MRMDKWEYMTCTYTNKMFALLFRELNEWGERGWELVSYTAKPGDGILYVYECIFKRKKKRNNN